MTAKTENILEIAQLGHAVLRERAQDVEDVRKKSLQTLIDDMIATMLEANGVGIAAPQVYRSERIFIVASQPNPRYPDAPDMHPIAMINPKIVAHDDTIVKDWEGCLSIPGIRGLVPRHRAIEIEFTDRHGKHHKQQYDDFVARICQHELDHLDGVVFLDRMHSMHDLVTEQSFFDLILRGQDEEQ